MKSLVFRYTAALLLAFSANLFYSILLPLTLYTSYILLQLGTDVTLSEATLTLGGASFTFIPACTAALAFLFLGELILLTKGITLHQGLKLFAFGSLTIFSMNIVRIFVLITVYLQFGKEWFSTLHLIWWHLLSTIFIAFVWIVLVERYKIKDIPVYSDIKALWKDFRKS